MRVPERQPLPEPAPALDPASAAGLSRRGRAAARGAVRRAFPFVGGIAVTLIALLAYGLVVPSHPLTRGDVADEIASALASVTPPPAWSELVYQAIAPSFVIVEASRSAVDPGAGGSGVAGPAPSGATPSGATETLGSGVVVDASGDILTALHVVSGAATIRVTFADGSQSVASVASQQPDHDVAVLRASLLPPTVVPATLGNPRSIQVGDDAYLVGNPFGLAGSMSAGVVSGLGRSFRNPDTGLVMSGLIQFDAAANPGNSGGPLLNRAGQVVGIVTALINPTGQDVFVGIGLAVPIDVAGRAAGLPPD
ncbi:MAG TPA: trypsin-like peptidase domain-containing protein [Candidatus Limnocylindrales bacterium]|nr:trypsin-like peptidase domain-containing protein [Candidatus Limnocylindrales bacterium]